MSGQWNRKVLTVIVAALACTAAAASISFAYPTQVASPTLGAEWQCHRAVGFLTTCSRVSHVVPTITRTPNRAIAIHQV
jgi:hypothetical protein